ncbi:hypothetical protein MMC24_002825 [Lignoscripta atroalba]|nr:hypothetical protein [Lignoscripta atroalba]
MNAEHEHEHKEIPSQCQQTAHPSLRAEPAVSIAPYIWALPYLHLHPDFCFVLDPGHNDVSNNNNKNNNNSAESPTNTAPAPAVGYILGTPDTKTYTARYLAEYIPTLPTARFPPPNADTKAPAPAPWDTDLPPGDALLQQLYSPVEKQDLLHAEFPQLVEEYPGHLHIDILPAYQRRGYGRELVGRFCERMGGVRGLHLVMAGDNVQAERFYGRVGFGRFGGVVDGGRSGEVGRDRNGSVWLVRRMG